MCFCFSIGLDSLLSYSTRFKPQCIFTMIKKNLQWYRHVQQRSFSYSWQVFKNFVSSYLWMAEVCVLIRPWFLMWKETLGGLYVLFEKIWIKRIMPEATGEEIMHHALLNFKEWRLIEMHKKLVFYWLNRIKAAVHSQRIIIELVLHCNSFTKSLYQIHLSRLDLLIWL